MTNQRRRDKESSAGCHRKRTKPRVRPSTLGYGDVSTAPARVAKCEALPRIILLAPGFFLQVEFILCRLAALPPCRGRLARRPTVPS